MKSDDLIIKNNVEYFRIEFLGKRTLNTMIKNWCTLKKIIKHLPVKLLIDDMMNGKFSTYDISYLFTEMDINISVRIAIILLEKESYNHRFFESVAMFNSINMKHFSNETEAVNWLLQT